MDQRGSNAVYRTCLSHPGRVAALCVMPLISIAIYLWQLGVRTLRSLFFPPSGTKVLHSVPVLSGDEALKHGNLAKVMGMILVSAALVMVIAFWRFAEQLVGPL